jgi:Flp pilus assembly protein TadG
MNRFIQRLWADRKGAAAIEIIFALPLLVTIMIGILQFALILQAQGAMRHGIGEGLRMAKVNAAATEAQILDRARASMGGSQTGNITAMDFTRGTTTVNGEIAEWGRITIDFEMQPVIPVAAVPPIQLTATRTVYLPG